MSDLVAHFPSLVTYIPLSSPGQSFAISYSSTVCLCDILTIFGQSLTLKTKSCSYRNCLFHGIYIPIESQINKRIKQQPIVRTAKQRALTGKAHNHLTKVCDFKSQIIVKRDSSRNVLTEKKTELPNFYHTFL